MSRELRSAPSGEPFTDPLNGDPSLVLNQRGDFITGGGSGPNVEPSVQSSDFNVPDSATGWIVYKVDTTGGAVTATLPSAPAVGLTIGLKDVGGDVGTNPAIANGNGNSVDGNATGQLRLREGAEHWTWDGTEWRNLITALGDGSANEVPTAVGSGQGTAWAAPGGGTAQGLQANYDVVGSIVTDAAGGDFEVTGTEGATVAVDQFLTLNGAAGIGMTSTGGNVNLLSNAFTTLEGQQATILGNSQVVIEKAGSSLQWMNGLGTSGQAVVTDGISQLGYADFPGGSQGASGILNVSDGASGWQTTGWQSFGGNDLTNTVGGSVSSPTLVLLGTTSLSLNGGGTDFIANFGGGQNNMALQSAGQNKIHGLTGGGSVGAVSPLQLNGIGVPSQNSAADPVYVTLPEAAGTVTQYYGDDGTGQMVARDITSDEVSNVSTVAGATVSDALDNVAGGGATGAGIETFKALDATENQFMTNNTPNGRLYLMAFTPIVNATIDDLTFLIAQNNAGGDGGVGIYDAAGIRQAFIGLQAFALGINTLTLNVPVAVTANTLYYAGIEADINSCAPLSIQGSAVYNPPVGPSVPPLAFTVDNPRLSDPSGFPADVSGSFGNIGLARKYWLQGTP